MINNYTIAISREWKMKIKRLPLVSIFLLAFFNYSIAQTYFENDLKNFIIEKSQPDINNFILDKVTNNRVVMIADEGHGNYIFMRTITNFLNHWIHSYKDEIEDQKIPRKLYLILESDSNQINSIYRFFSNNDPYELLNPEFIYGDQYTSGVIEFYYDLRKIYCEIESMNKNRSKENQISLKLFGPEKVIDLNDWSSLKRDDFFLHERDEYSSTKILNQLEKDSTYQALIFYGGAHLNPHKTQKLPNNSETGYFIGHYLLKHFKDNGGFYSIDQLSSDSNTWLDDCFKCSQFNYVIENSIFDGYSIKNNMRPQFTDASIILFDKYIRQPHISQIWSNNLIDCFFNNVNKFTNISSEFNKGIISSWLFYLVNISGSEFEILDYNDSIKIANVIFKWKNWRYNLNINFAEAIVNQDIIKNRIKLFENSDYPIAGQYEFMLSSLLNTKVWYGSGAAPRVRAEKYYEYLQKYSKPLIAENLINLLWVGTEVEKSKAIEYLKNTFALDFNSAKEWMEWWRNSEYCK